MSRADFVGGSNWVIVGEDGNWSHVNLPDGTDPAEKFAGLDYHAVNRPPDDFETWNGTEGWKLDLIPIQAQRVAEARRVRVRRLALPVPTSFGAIDRDGRELLERLARLATAGEIAEAEVPLADGPVTLTAEQLIETQLEVDRHIVATVSAGWAIEKNIRAGRSRPTIAAVDIEAGYP